VYFFRGVFCVDANAAAVVPPAKARGSRSATGTPATATPRVSYAPMSPLFTRALPPPSPAALARPLSAQPQRLLLLRDSTPGTPLAAAAAGLTATGATADSAAHASPARSAAAARPLSALSLRGDGGARLTYAPQSPLLSHDQQQQQQQLQLQQQRAALPLRPSSAAPLRAAAAPSQSPVASAAFYGAAAADGATDARQTYMRSPLPPRSASVGAQAAAPRPLSATLRSASPVALPARMASGRGM
jgi:hypothetical protein